MIYGYSRVSTQGQVEHGNSLTAQEEDLRKAGATKVYTDAGVSGAKKPEERPQLSELLQVLQEGDTLVITRLDRLSRSAVSGYELIAELLSKGVSVRVLNIGTVENTVAGRLILHILLAFSEFEKETIRERMMEGKVQARQDPSWRDGRRPKYTMAQTRHAVELLKTHTYAQVEAMTGMSKSTLIRAVKAEKRRCAEAGEMNFRDKAWYDAVVEGAEQMDFAKYMNEKE